MDLVWGGETLRLRADRSIWLPEHATLLVADMHVGKGQSFRRLGVPVPQGSSAESLNRLSAALVETGARALVVLGDLLHAAAARDGPAGAALAAWRAAHPDLELTLVRGNHDDRAGDPPAALGFAVVDEPWSLGGLALAHHPRPQPGRAVLAGHIHPGLRLRAAGESLRLPCFHFDARRQVGLLPAFGAFTGLHTVQPRPGDQTVLIAGPALRRWSPGGD